MFLLSFMDAGGPDADGGGELIAAGDAVPFEAISNVSRCFDIDEEGGIKIRRSRREVQGRSEDKRKIRSRLSEVAYQWCRKDSGEKMAVQVEVTRTPEAKVSTEN
jgi:lysyl-tRNA synthetase class I